MSKNTLKPSKLENPPNMIKPKSNSQIEKRPLLPPKSKPTETELHRTF
jgi:hypothetical protein